MAVRQSGAATPRRPYAARMPADERRTQLLDAAIEIIVRDGYDNVSVDAIAREAGVTRPVVYGVFDGLRPLLLALLDRQQRRALEQLAAVLPDATDLGDPAASVPAAVRRMLALVADDPLTWRPILFAGESAPLAVRERIEGDRERVRRQIAGLLDAVAPRGGRSQLDTEVMAHALVAIFEHFGRLMLADPPRFDADRLVAAVRQVIVALNSP